MELHILFWGLFLVGSNVEKWVNRQKQEFFINNSVEAVILFNEKHQGILKLGGGVSVDFLV